MSSPDHAVITARAALNRAEHEQKEHERTEFVKRLEGVRADLRAAKARYFELAHGIKAARENVTKIRDELKRAVEALSQSMDTRPRVADILPGDPEVVQWRRRQEALEAGRDRIMARLHAAPDPSTNLVECVRYEGPGGIVAQLEHSEANLLRQLDPRSEEWRTGGVNRVG